jgi:hypothetical protein
MDFSARMVFADLGKHGAGQNHAAHFGQHDDQYFLDWLRPVWLMAKALVPQRNHTT